MSILAKIRDLFSSKRHETPLPDISSAGLEFYLLEGGEPEETFTSIVVSLDNGMELTVSMMLDKDGNETDIMFDAVILLAKGPDGAWYEIEVKDCSWVAPTQH